MDNEELLVALRSTVHEVVNASEQRTRALIREEVNAAVYASEQRIGEQITAAISASEQRIGEQITAAISASEQRIGEQITAAISASEQRIEGRFDKVEERLNKLEGMVLPMAEHLRLLGIRQRERVPDVSEMRVEQAIGILELATIKINEFEQTQNNLENKVEEYLKVLERDMQRLHTMLQDFTKAFNFAI